MDSLGKAVLSRDPAAVALALRELLGFDFADYDSSAEWMVARLAGAQASLLRGVSALMQLRGPGERDREVIQLLAEV
eukprot:4175932-Prymnesium_polylepis.1